MSWHKVVFDTDSDPPNAAPLTLAQNANKIFVVNSAPKDFAIFSELGPAGRSYTLYFSPVAAQLCAHLLREHSSIACDKPEPSGETFTQTAGSPYGWDILR